MFSRSWAALAVLMLACAATHTAPPPGETLDDNLMIRRGKIALTDDPGTRACVESAAERSAATDVARRNLTPKEH
jgi:hypothetical protein